MMGHCLGIEVPQPHLRDLKGLKGPKPGLKDLKLGFQSGLQGLQPGFRDLQPGLRDWTQVLDSGLLLH